jgi:Ras-related protein Rab-11A
MGSAPSSSSTTTETSVSTVVNIVVVGPSAIGKSSLLLRWSRDEFSNEYKKSTHPEFAVRSFDVDGETVNVR